MTDINEAARLALITCEPVALVLEEAEIAEDEARAFSQDRARQQIALRYKFALTFLVRRGSH